MAKKNQQAPRAAEAPKAAVAVAEAPKPAVQPLPNKVDFDVWWVLTKKSIPGHHYKEIIQADFRARGLSLKETMQSYNDALNKYGLKLK